MIGKMYLGLMLLGPKVTKPIILKLSMMKEKHLRKNVIQPKIGLAKSQCTQCFIFRKICHKCLFDHMYLGLKFLWPKVIEPIILKMLMMKEKHLRQNVI